MAVTFYKITNNGYVEEKYPGGEYGAKVYPLVCDRLTLTCDMPDSVKSHYKGYFKQEEAKPSKGYRLSGMIKGVSMKTPPYLPDDEDKITSAYIQCDPYDDKVGFVRIDFNPSKVDMVNLKGYVDTNWLTGKEYGFDYVLKYGKVTRIDFAVDIASEVVDDLYYYYKQMSRVEVIRSNKGETEYVEGQTEYLGGKVKSAKRIAIYNRIPAIKAHNYKKYWDPNLQIPLPDNDIMRVEVRLSPKSKTTIKQILSLSNPFLPLTIASLRYAKHDDLLWKFFIPLARFEGATATLARLPKPTKNKYLERLKKGKVAWWRPAEVWEQLPAVIKSITDA